MAESAGYGGYVKEGSNWVVGMRNWTCPQLANVGEITDFQSSGLKEFKLTLKEWSGGFDGALDGTPLNLGATYTLHLGLTGSTEYYGSAIITGIDPGVTVDGINALSYSFKGTAALTFTP
jgi:hypothetical protein